MKKLDFQRILHPFKTMESRLRDEYENLLIEEMKYAEDKPSIRVSTDDQADVYELDVKSAILIAKELAYKDPKLKERIILEGDNWVVVSTGGSQDDQRVQQIDDLQSMQDAAFNKSHTDPIIKSIANNVQFYTIGRGMRFEAANEKVQNVLTEYWVANKMNEMQKKMVRSAWVEGEYFILYFVNPRTGRVKWRRIPNKDITDIETHPEDINTILSYKREFIRNKKSEERWYQDINYQVQLEDDIDAQTSEQSFDSDKYMQFIKYGEENELRGRVPMDTVLRYSKLYKDWVYDRARLNHERSKVVWIKELLRGYEAKSHTMQAQRSPKGGVMLIETQGVKYRIEAPKIDARDAKDDGLAILYQVCAGVNMPVSLVNQRYDEQVYASIRKADAPFASFIMTNQDFWADEFDEMFKFVIRINIDAGELPEKSMVPKFTSMKRLEEIQHKINEMICDGKTDKEIIKEVEPMVRGKQKQESVPTKDVHITKIFPEIVKEDIFNMSRSLEIHRRIGILSAQTGAEKAGYNWKEELYRMSVEKAAGIGQQEEVPPFKRDFSNSNPNDKKEE